MNSSTTSQSPLNPFREQTQSTIHPASLASLIKNAVVVLQIAEAPAPADSASDSLIPSFFREPATSY